MMHVEDPATAVPDPATAPTAARWLLVKSIFERALTARPQARAALLDDACGKDSELRAEVESLLAAHEQAGTFIEAPAPLVLLAGDFVQSSEPAVSARRFGPYRVVREIGRGGMGVVYLAERDDETYRKQVAIKVVHAAGRLGELKERFRQERQILAQLEHVNIARLLDAGDVDDVPYLVMEYVEGVPIDTYCAERGLSVAQRLSLFRQVCAAVQYAHQNLVIHRDLKPGNILVTADGTPKLLDFGIAKLLDASRVMPAETSVTRLRIFTPEYASPEQIRGEAVTTLSDVYSLGVVLYFLLTGRWPYVTRSGAPHEVVRAVCEEEPEPPSAAIDRPEERSGDLPTGIPQSPQRVRQNRPERIERLRRQLAGDLGTIVMKAIRKDPARRYASAEQLSQDLQRFLSGRPVLARKDTLGYRMSRFVARHLLAVAAGVVILAALASTTVLALWQAGVARAERSRSERRFGEVRGIANTLLFEVHDAIEKLPGSVAARELLIKRSLEYLDRLASEAAGDRALQRELATAYTRIGLVQGGPGAASRGDTARALESQRKALDVRRALAEADPEDSDARWDLSASYIEVGSLMQARGDAAGALQHFRDALAIRERLSKARGTRQYRSGLGIVYHHVGQSLVALGDLAGARESFEHQSRIFEALAAEEPGSPRAQRNVSIANKKLGAVLEALGDRSAAIQKYRRALEIDQALSAAAPDNARLRLDVSFALAALAYAQAQAGDAAAALDNYRKALAIRETLAAADPADMLLRDVVARAHTSLGAVLAKTGDARSASSHYRRALAILDERSRVDPADVEVRAQVADTYALIGDLHAEQASSLERGGRPLRQIADEWREARRWYRRNLQLWTDMRDRGVLLPRFANRPSLAENEIRRCDETLARLEVAGARASKD